MKFKKQKSIKIRKNWIIDPVTRIVVSKKIYSRKKNQNFDDDL